MYPKKFPQVSLIDRAPQLNFSTLEKTKIDHNPLVYILLDLRDGDVKNVFNGALLRALETPWLSSDLFPTCKRAERTRSRQDKTHRLVAQWHSQQR